MSFWSWIRAKQGFVTDAPVTPDVPSKPTALDVGALFSTHMDFPDEETEGQRLKVKLDALAAQRPQIEQPADAAPGMVAVMDADDTNGCGSVEPGYTYGQPNISSMLADWYGTQSFIGHQLAAIIAQNWLIWKACAMPARDAIRNWFTVVNSDGDDIDPKLRSVLARADKAYKLKRNLREFVTMGRVFGIRICIYAVESADDKYYEKPFNIDGVTRGSYKGMIQVDPYWCAPILDQRDGSQPDSMHFYEPTWWMINGKRYHRSHLAIYRNGSVADILKPQYLYGGIPVPQQIMERVYGAERTANEAPLLALTKRTVVYKTDLGKFVANFAKGVNNLLKMSRLWSNQGQRVIGLDETLEQHETALGDFDALIMTQYQLVCAAAEVPATKMLGTSAKGFNATGEHDESNYHESLESIQEHDLSPFVEGHYARVMRSANIDDSLLAEARGLTLEPKWNPLDTPTAKEIAEINKINSEADEKLVASGGIDGLDVRRRIAEDPTSNYSGIVVAPDTALTTTDDIPPIPQPIITPAKVKNDAEQAG